MKKSIQENVDLLGSLTKEQISGIKKGLADVKSGRIISNEKVWEKYGRKTKM
jgi:predicted transcriptional regulator